MKAMSGMDLKTQFLFVLLSVLAIFSEGFNPYCELKTCCRRSHTLCRFPFPGMSYQCGMVIRYNLTEGEKDRILYLHNHLRYKVYSGNETRGRPGPMPRAKYFNYLRWDQELEITAQRWADQCHFAHDLCRHLRRFLVGQNIGYEITFGHVEVIKVDLVVRKWYEGVKTFHRNNIVNFRRSIVERTLSEKFSQMIWSQTTHIGCGSLRYFDGAYSIFLLICNYGPRGNNDGQSVYPALEEDFKNWY